MCIIGAPVLDEGSLSLLGLVFVAITQQGNRVLNHAKFYHAFTKPCAYPK